MASLGLGCGRLGFESHSRDVELDGANGASDGATSMMMGFRDGASVDAADLDASPTDAGPADGSAADGSAVDSGCAAEVCSDLYRTCGDLARRCPCAASGTYLLDPDVGGPVAEFLAYCDMEIDGGGWTLVGRSAARGLGDFGWPVDAGRVDVDREPYSLDVVGRGYPFTEILFGSYTTGKTWGPNVFAITVPADFLVRYQGNNVFVERSLRVASGSCAPTPADPFMFKQVGYTAETWLYYFRDVPELGNFGLMPDGFNLAGTDCDRSGELDQRQGMIFVR